MNARSGRGTVFDMLTKIVLVFLVGMAGLAVFGRLRLPGAGKRGAYCASCGRPRVGTGACPCGKA
jgi:hypothetical protein